MIIQRRPPTWEDVALDLAFACSVIALVGAAVATCVLTGS